MRGRPFGGARGWGQDGDRDETAFACSSNIGAQALMTVAEAARSRADLRNAGAAGQRTDLRGNGGSPHELRIAFNAANDLAAVDKIGLLRSIDERTGRSTRTSLGRRRVSGGPTAPS